MSKPAGKPKEMPILARHAVSLCVVFVLGIVLSYFAGQAIYERVQLGKLSSTDQATFERGVGYVLTHAGSSEAVTAAALSDLKTIDAQRAADLLLAIAQSHARRKDTETPTIPPQVTAAIRPLMDRMQPLQAIGLYDGLVKISGIDAIEAANQLLASLDPKDEQELLQVVELLDTRLIWSSHWAPTDLWLRWLIVLSDSKSELTQFNTAKRLGDLPEVADDPRLPKVLTALAQSEHDTVRNRVLSVCAGYAAIAEDPTDYEQIIFELGQDENKVIARRAWMVVGHLNPFSGFAVNWKGADPFVAEGMLWAAAKTNPENAKPILDALQLSTPAPRMDIDMARSSLLGLAHIDDREFSSIERLIGSTDWALFVSEEIGLSFLWRLVLATELDPEAFELFALGSSLLRDLKLFKEEQSSLAFALRCAFVYRNNDRIYEDDVLLSEEWQLLDLAKTEGKILTPLSKSKLNPEYPIGQLIALSSGNPAAGLDGLISKLPLGKSTILDLVTLALTNADGKMIDRYIRSGNPQMVTAAALASAINGDVPQLITGFDLDFPRRHPDLSIDEIRTMSDAELSELGLSRTDALPALLQAAESAPPSANRSAEAKLLKLALWMRGDLGEEFTPIAEAMLFDDEMPASTVLMCLLHMKRPAALDYVFGDLATPRPDLHKLFIQERYWHVFRRFVDTSDLTLWLWGDPAAQAFQLEAMQQWYTVNRWKIEQGWWPEVIDD